MGILFISSYLCFLKFQFNSVTLGSPFPAALSKDFCKSSIILLVLPKKLLLKLCVNSFQSTRLKLLELTALLHATWKSHSPKCKYLLTKARTPSVCATESALSS